MGIKKIVGVCPAIELFEVKKYSKTTIRLICNRTGLFQECVLIRKGDHYVHGRLIEFGGSRFAVRISLKKKTVTLLDPNYAGWADAAPYPNLVAHTIASMLLEKKSTKVFNFVRKITDITNRS